MDKTRYKIIDEMRGFIIINMVVYHALWDCVYQYNVSIAWYRSSAVYVWQQYICWSFVLISGFCWKLSKHHVKNGLILSGSGLLVSVVSFLFFYDARIIFGILTLLGCCIFIMIFLDKFLIKIPSFLGISSSFLLFIFTKNINKGYLGFTGKIKINLPSKLYHGYFLTFIGFEQKNFYSSDYFSLIPWIFLFMTGYFSYSFMKKKKVIQNLGRGKIPALGWIGRRSLIIYLLHQPILNVFLFAIYR